jgi:Domain of unknown function (DUF4261)
MGFISNIFARKGASQLETKPFLVMVALSASVPITEGLVRKGLDELGSPTSLGDCSGREGTLSCTILDSTEGPGQQIGTTALSLMPAPIPWTELESACARSWHWPEAAAVLQPHTRHWVIYVHAKSDPAYASAIAVRITCALLDQPGVLGIYVGSAGLVHSAEFWRANLDSEENACAADLWVHFAMEAYPDGTTSLRTQGLDNFGVMEIEMIRSSKPYEEMYERARELAGYLIYEGPVLADGHTVGRTADEKIIVRHEPSAYAPNEMVHRIYV